MIDEAIALGAARHVFRPGDWVFDAAFTPDGKTVVAAARDGNVRRYDLATGAMTIARQDAVGSRGARDLAGRQDGRHRWRDGRGHRVAARTAARRSS